MLENVEEFKTWGPLLQDGMPDPDRKGRTFQSFVNALRRQGYQVDWRELRACDYGAPTIRKRFFMVSRRDGLPIVWPDPTHGDPESLQVKAGRLKPWRTAGEIIDWSVPVQSIFDRRKPLSENTMRRIGRGMWKFIINNPQPFIAPVEWRAGNHSGPVAAFLAKYHTETNHDARGQTLDRPLLTQDTSNRFALVTAHLIKYRGSNIGQALNEPLHTVTAGGTHHALVYAFLVAYYGSSVGQSLQDPLGTVTTHDRFGLVMVKGTPYEIVDIGMRMLEPHELFAAQGFPDTYIIDRDPDGKSYPKSAQVARCGNSVPPPFAEALVRANLPEHCAGAGNVAVFERYKEQPAGQLALSI
jgi:DNA (cytosine-5)-methyltransferase 1